MLLFCANVLFKSLLVKPRKHLWQPCYVIFSLNILIMEKQKNTSGSELAMQTKHGSIDGTVGLNQSNMKTGMTENQAHLQMEVKRAASACVHMATGMLSHARLVFNTPCAKNSSVTIRLFWGATSVLNVMMDLITRKSRDQWWEMCEPTWADPPDFTCTYLTTFNCILLNSIKICCSKFQLARPTVRIRIFF